MNGRTGGCHCKRVRFRVKAADPEVVYDCCCSMCRTLGYLHWIVPLAQFELLSGRQSLTEYRFNTGVARHLFCRVCGIKSFYAPRSHPGSVSVNVRCLDGAGAMTYQRVPFDGVEWEAAFAELAERPS